MKMQITMSLSPEGLCRTPGAFAETEGGDATFGPDSWLPSLPGTR